MEETSQVAASEGQYIWSSWNDLTSSPSSSSSFCCRFSLKLVTIELVRNTELVDSKKMNKNNNTRHLLVLVLVVTAKNEWQG